MDRKLLCAAGQCYAIAGDGPVGPWNPAPHSRCGDVGWIGAVDGVTAGKYADDAGLVGRVNEGVIIALRGTIIGAVPGKWLSDWINNLAIQMTPADDGAYPGLSHGGFRLAARNVLDELAPAIRAAVAAADAARPDGSPAPIYVTGHSKGGGMAPFAAWWLRTNHPDPVAEPGRQVVVRTFAAPAIANAAFRAAYAAVGIDHVRYECDGDLVPLLPLTGNLLGAVPLPVMAAFDLPVDGGYAPLGALRYITPGAFAAPATVDAARRTALGSIAANLLVGVYPTARHEIFQGSTYCGAPYP